jgi:hypothetical protein
MSSWTRLGVAPSGALADARGQAHWAAQAVSAVGSTLATPRDDYSHTALCFEHGVLWSELIDAHRVGVRVADLTVVVASSDGSTPDGFNLVGRTLEETTREIRLHLTRRSGHGIRALKRPEHELPAHPVGRGASFEGAPTVGLDELAAWFDNAAAVLAPVGAREDGSGLRCWPHHFDLATLLTVNADPLKTIGVGMSPGDGSYADPYFYVTPWPYPARAGEDTLPGGGRWHTEGWTGAVLTSDAIRVQSDPQAQRAATEAFLTAAIDAATDLLA